MEKAHVHCLICGRPYDYNDRNKTIRRYICKECMNTFPTEYINFRIDCFKNGLYDKGFDLLEHRLTFGANGYIDPKYLPKSSYFWIDYKCFENNKNEDEDDE